MSNQVLQGRYSTEMYFVHKLVFVAAFSLPRKADGTCSGSIGQYGGEIVCEISDSFKAVFEGSGKGVHLHLVSQCDVPIPLSDDIARTVKAENPRLITFFREMSTELAEKWPECFSTDIPYPAKFDQSLQCKLNGEYHPVKVEFVGSLERSELTKLCTNVQGISDGLKQRNWATPQIVKVNTHQTETGSHRTAMSGYGSHFLSNADLH